MFLLYLHANAVNNNKGSSSSGEQASGLAMEFSIKVKFPVVAVSFKFNLLISKVFIMG